MMVWSWLGILLFFLLAVFREVRRGSIQPKRKILLLTKDNEDIVEGIVREAAVLVCRLEGRLELAVMDCCSQDDTPQILRKLKEQGLSFELILNAEIPGKLPCGGSRELQIFQVFMYGSNPHELLKEIWRQRYYLF